MSPFSRVCAVVSPWGPWMKYQKVFFRCSPPLLLFTKLRQRELFYILPCLLTFRVKKTAPPKICWPSDNRQSTNSSPTLGQQNRDYFRKYELSRLSQIGWQSNDNRSLLLQNIANPFHSPQTHTHTQLIRTPAINDDCGSQPGSNAIGEIQTRITVFNPSSLIPMSSIGSSKGKPSGKRRFTSCQHWINKINK